MSAKNIHFYVTGFGSRSAYALSITLGTNIISLEESGNAKGRVFHPFKVTSSSFDTKIIHANYADYVDFNEWMMSYVQLLAEPSSPVGPMRITAPVRKFDKIAIPKTGISFGRSVGEYTWTQNLGFVGASDPLDISNTKDIVQLSGVYSPTYAGESEYISSPAIALLGDTLFPSKLDATYGGARNPWANWPPGVL